MALGDSERLRKALEGAGKILKAPKGPGGLWLWTVQLLAFGLQGLEGF